MRKKTMQTIDRRSFLKWSGMSAAVATTIVSCDDESSGKFVDLGGGDTGLLKYSYLIELLQAEFYTQVTSGEKFTTSFNTEEQTILTDIRDHEIAHREFFKNALGIDFLEEIKIEFKDVDFSNRTLVLVIATQLEDMAIGAYNYAGKLFTDTNLLVVAAKVVSVEARHSSVVRDLLQPRTASFAGDDVVDSSGFDVVKSPQEVMEIAGKYIVTKINVNSLPTN